jgi:hypothetical protein
MNGFGFRHDPMRRARRHVDEIPDRHIEIANRPGAELDTRFARHLRQHGVLLADQKEGLLHAIAAQMKLRIDAELQHRHFVIGLAQGRFFERVEIVLASHDASPVGLTN